jgi:hypothetical protein
LPTYDNDDRYTPAPTNPYSHPPCALPSTCPPICASLDVSESHDHIEPEDHACTPSLYSNLDELHHNYNLGIPSAVTYMQGLQEYTEECLREQEEWKADEQAEICNNHWIKYPKCDFYTTPHSWDPTNRQSVPHTIEKSRPFYPTLKRRHYKNHRTKRYPNPQSQSQSPSSEQQHLGEDRNTTHTLLPPTTLNNKHHGYNNSLKPRYHTNSLSTPYSPTRLHPPPWPNKKPNKNHNKYHYSTHSPADTTAKQRPPPWPNIPTPIPILTIGNSHPPPWPIICHC